MVKQYPNTLKVLAAAAGQQDAHGNWQVTGDQPEAIELPCRIEYNKRGRSATVTGVDGSAIDYTSIVYMPLPFNESLKIGATIEVYNGNSLFVRSTIKQVSEGQLNVRVWL